MIQADVEVDAVRGTRARSSRADESRCFYQVEKIQTRMAGL